MGYLQTVTEPEKSRIVTDTFYGLNETMHPSDGEWQATRNLSSDYAPLLAPRRERTAAAGTSGTQGMAAKTGLYHIMGGTLYANGAATALTGLSEPSITASATAPASPGAGQYWYDTGSNVCKVYRNSTWELCPYPQKQIVSMGAYLIIWPDKKYYNTENGTDYGSIDAVYAVTDQSVTYTICKSDGTAYGTPAVQDTAPEDPGNGDLWIDTSKPTHALYQYSTTNAQWVSIATVYVKITFPTVGTMTGLQTGDGVTLSGIDGTSDMEALNGSHVLHDAGGGNGVNDYIVITGIIDGTRVQTTGTVRAAREAPEMDYVIEAGNRLWGCKYGNVNGTNVNELYCCKLGDFKNWTCYDGIATDSWAASVGSDGAWTGAYNYLGYPTFFKADRMHRISISSSGAHQVTETACRGVAAGCNRSLAMVDEVLYYVSRDGICAYDGSLPGSVSAKIPGVYTLATAGTVGKKYYLSARRDGAWKLLVLDVSAGYWIMEDETQAAGFARYGTALEAVTVSDSGITSIEAITDTTVKTACTALWKAESGIQGYEYTNHKRLSRFDFRMQVPRGASVHLEMEYDSDGVWNDCGTVQGMGTNSFVLPVRPRRCDHVRYRLSGYGDVRIYSVSRVLEVGSDV